MTLLVSSSSPGSARAGALVSGSTGRLAMATALSIVGWAADLSGGTAPLCYAAILILALGLPHGASDHLVAMRGQSAFAAPKRFAAFLGAYLSAVVASLALWYATPGLALSAFLLLSAIHFALDDVPGEPWHRLMPERLARGLMPFCLPALLHSRTLAGLFANLSTPTGGETLAVFAATLAPLVAGLAGFAALQRLHKHEIEPAMEIVLSALVLTFSSPLVGFALVFALVHSRGQTRERIADLQLSDLRAYLYACLPTLLGAAIFFVILLVLLAESYAPALNALFIGLSALTVPHMIVAPIFKRDQP